MTAAARPTRRDRRADLGARSGEVEPAAEPVPVGWPGSLTRLAVDRLAKHVGVTDARIDVYASAVDGST